MKHRTWLLLFFSLQLFADATPDDGNPTTDTGPKPYFTGTLLAPVGEIVPLGDFEMNNYFFYTNTTGAYDANWTFHKAPSFQTFNPQIYFSIGLAEWMDVQITTQFIQNNTQGKTYNAFGDLPIALEFQLYPTDASNFPGVKFAFIETFPTGKFDNLDPKDLGADQIGEGAYASTFSLILYRVYPIGSQFMSMTLNAAYTIAPPFHIQGYNLYGGNQETDGRIHPGNNFTASASFEFSLSQHWNLAFDSLWTSSLPSTFFGTPGIDGEGKDLVLDTPSSGQLSFAPAIEYGFDENFGLVVGSWFTAIGRNADAFWSVAANLYCYF